MLSQVLVHQCDMMGTAIYNTSWTNASPRMMKNLVIVLRRCQEPVTVSVRCLLPTLSLRYYATVRNRVYENRWLPFMIFWSLI